MTKKTRDKEGDMTGQDWVGKASTILRTDKRSYDQVK